MFNRRQLFGASVTGFAAYATQQGKAAAFAKSVETAARRCIILWMDGGPSQFETFDPKPGTSNGGAVKAIPTDVDDLQISEFLPSLSRHAADLNVIRTVTSNEGEHERARYLNHTGFKPISGFPRPELGALFAHELHRGELPGFITLGGEGYGPAYLGEANAPFTISDPADTLRQLRKLRSSKQRFRLLDELSTDFDHRHSLGPVRKRKATLQRVEGLLDSDLTEILDVNDEGGTTNPYGKSEFANKLRMARRLLEGGVTCVEVQLSGWDTHTNNFATVANLCRQLDGPWSFLIDDLKNRDLWKDTLIVWMGDFGRTPTINSQQGRDHFPAISNAVLAGAGLPGGVVIGRTSRTGTQIEEQPVTTADLFATILHQIGVAPDQEYQTSFGSPTEATDDGKPVETLQSRQL